MALLKVDHLTTRFHTREGTFTAVDDVSFKLEQGEILGIVGESGSGKSVCCYSLLGLIPCPPGKIESGTAFFHDTDLLTLKEKTLRGIRGNKIGMIFQDPMTSLNPYLKIGEQIIEGLRAHRALSKAQARLKAIQSLEEVGIHDAANRIDHYPHEFSGGMRQRVMIAMALITEPEILIADEPTTALDVTIQAQIVALIRDLQKRKNLAVIFITHDLGVVADIADNILVMNQGKVVERGDAHSLFEQPKEAYTQKLIAAIPNSAKPEGHKFTGSDAAFIHAKTINTFFSLSASSIFSRKKPRFHAVKDVDLDLRKGEIVGLVGESGSGKSTLGRSLIRLIEPSTGQILIDATDIRSFDKNALKHARKQFQMIFQDPYASLNPRMTVFDTLAEPMLIHGLASKENVLLKVNALMDDVGLERSAIRKYPHEFSGGQRQRIAIARALAVEPAIIIADEPVSALDVTIQAQILDLLLNLVKERELTMLFISHDLSVVRYLCDRVVVMKRGEIVERGETEALFAEPQHAYTQALLNAIVSLP